MGHRGEYGAIQAQGHVLSGPRWYSQRFRPDGGISAEGLRNQLGRPALSTLTVLVRESAQNSWDAKAAPVVDYGIELGTVGAAHASAWRELLASNSPVGPAENFPLRPYILGRGIRYLSISDRGTAGLGGPTRSDAATELGEDRNWLSFVLNSGDKQDTEGGGGTYGFGKGAFFLASRCGAIMIYSRFREPTGLRSRLIGSALVRSYNFQGVPYTGRHWWGLAEQDHCEPLLDQAADEAAKRLALRPFEGEETGTTVVVIDPDLTDPSLPEAEAGDMDLAAAGRLIADVAAWNLWPLTLEGREQRLRVSVSVDGLAVSVPSELDDPALAAFADAYRAATGTGARTVMCGRPRRQLGTSGSAVTVGAEISSFAASEHDLSGPPHHFAVMRRPDLVVRYVAGQPKQSPMVGYAGVFKVSDELDPVFARAEPPTHDAWIDKQLTGNEATFVRTAAVRVRELCDELAGLRTTVGRAKSVAVGSLSQRLGHLMAGPGGLGAVRSVTRPAARGGDATVAAGGAVAGGGVSSPGGQAVAGRKPRLTEPPSWERIDGRLMVVQRVSIPSPAVYRGVCRVITGDGGHESAAPSGGSTPRVYGWRVGTTVTLGSEFDSWVLQDVELIVEPVSDVVCDITVEVVP